MRSASLFVLAVALITALGAAPMHVLDEEEPIEGTWTVVSRIADGEEVDLEEGDIKFTMKNGRLRADDQGQEIEGSYEFNTHVEPHELDVTIEVDGQRITLRAIFEFKDDMLRTCVAMRPDAERPDRFESQLGSEWVLDESRRVR